MSKKVKILALITIGIVIGRVIDIEIEFYD